RGGAGLRQGSGERSEDIRIGPRQGAAEKPDYRYRRLLRARRERPRGRRAAQQRDERAALHSITSSARASTVLGTSMLSDSPVLRLLTRWNLVGSTTGSSSGFSPRTIRPT